jgi:hypothetical protein
MCRGLSDLNIEPLLLSFFLNKCDLANPKTLSGPPIKKPTPKSPLSPPQVWEGGRLLWITYYVLRIAYLFILFS